MNQKSIIAILGVFVVILIGITVYFATIKKVATPVAPAPKVVQQPAPTSPPAVQAADETTSWQTYSNTKLGFGFKYPKDFIISEAGDTVGLKINDTSKPVDQRREVPFVSMEILSSKKDKLVTDAATRLNDPNVYQNVFNVTVVVGDKVAEQVGNYGSKNSVEAVYKEIFVELNPGKTLVIKDVEMDNNVMNNILSSFKFTK